MIHAYVICSDLCINYWAINYLDRTLPMTHKTDSDLFPLGILKTLSALSNLSVEVKLSVDRFTIHRSITLVYLSSLVVNNETVFRKSTKYQRSQNKHAK